MNENPLVIQMQEAHRAGRVYCLVCGGLVQPNQPLSLNLTEGKLTGAHRHCALWAQTVVPADAGQAVRVMSQLHAAHSPIGHEIGETYTHGVDSVICAQCQKAVPPGDIMVWPARPREALHVTPCLQDYIVTQQTQAIQGQSLTDTPRFVPALGGWLVDAASANRDALGMLAQVERAVKTQQNDGHSLLCPGCWEPVIGEFRLGIRLVISHPKARTFMAFHSDCLPTNVPLVNLAAQHQAYGAVYFSAHDSLLIADFERLLRGLG